MADIAQPFVLNKDVLWWHCRLGHPNFHYLKRLFPGLFMNKDPKDFREICQLAEHIRTSFPAKPYKESSPFSLVHSDVWGPSRIHNVIGTRWFITFIDNHTFIFSKKGLKLQKSFKVFMLW